MDSKLVVEQMSGRWKIKHADMKPLALEANRLAPFGTTYTWVPREQNQHADRLANEALDGLRSGVTYYGARPRSSRGPSRATRSPRRPRRCREAQRAPEPRASGAGRPTPTCGPRSSWSGTASPPHTAEKRFSGGLASTNPGLSDEGRDQVRATADWLAPLAERVDALVSLAGTPHPGVGRHPRRAVRAVASRRSPASPRWSSAPGTD